MKISRTCSFVLGLTFMAGALANVSPSSLKVKVYQIAVAESSSCSNPIVIFSSETGVESNFISNPVFGGGNIPDGTYHCVIMTMSDLLKFIPATNEGSTCVAGTEYTIDVCRSDNGESTDQLTGTTFASKNCSGTSTPKVLGDDKVSLFIHSDGRTGNSAFRKGTSNGLQLTSPFVVAGSTIGTFVVDATNQISSSTTCDMNPPTFGFR